mmetsp:Transcript_20053/g.32669  ORF Transcript_20053/g.32669 Transcript_20053/m.32669 type:complete len:663 (+) Transcript_20053:2-1990(+)
MNDWKGKHVQLEKQHQDLLDERDDEAVMVNALENKLEGCRIVIESMKNNQEPQSIADTDAAAVDTSSAVVNDELVEKIGDLADENGKLLSKCRELERDLSSTKSSLETSVQTRKQDLQLSQMKNGQASATIDTLQVENRNLRESFANQGKKSNRQMKSLVRSLRSSLTLEDDGSLAHSVLADDEEFEEEEEDGTNSKKSYNKPITEMEHKEALAQLQDMQDENDTLHESMEEAIQIASGMKDKMTKFVSMHETTVKDYEAKLGIITEEYNGTRLSKEELSIKLETLKRENKTLIAELEQANSLVVCSVRDEIEKEQLSKESWNKEKRALSTVMENLKKENEKLHGSMKEMKILVATAEGCVGKLSEENTSMKDTHEYYEQQLQEMNVEKEANQYLREEIKGVGTEREEAYDTCKVLQKEINVLRKSLKESKSRVERLKTGNSFNSGTAEDGSSVKSGGSSSVLSKENQEKLTELTKANESIAKELEQKNLALQVVQSALEDLKVEQGTIKETIIDLRTENAKLRTMPLPPMPPSPKSILKREGSHGSNDSVAAGSSEKQFLKLESRMKKVEKENKGLREANSTLSAKLFDEMEKTDALRVANEGLAARICKLVAFIQQNPGSGGSGGGEQGGGGGASSSSSLRSVASFKKNKAPPPAPKKKK